MCVAGLFTPVWGPRELRTWKDRSGVGVLLPCPGCSARRGRPSEAMGLSSQLVSLHGHRPPRVSHPTRGPLRPQAPCLSRALGGAPLQCWVAEAPQCALGCVSPCTGALLVWSPAVCPPLQPHTYVC